jgi:hypothetical protein
LLFVLVTSTQEGVLRPSGQLEEHIQTSHLWGACRAGTRSPTCETHRFGRGGAGFLVPWHIQTPQTPEAQPPLPLLMPQEQEEEKRKKNVARGRGGVTHPVRDFPYCALLGYLGDRTFACVTKTKEAGKGHGGKSVFSFS